MKRPCLTPASKRLADGRAGFRGPNRQPSLSAIHALCGPTHPFAADASKDFFRAAISEKRSRVDVPTTIGDRSHELSEREVQQPSLDCSRRSLSPQPRSKGSSSLDASFDVLDLGFGDHGRVGQRGEPQ